MTERVVHRLNPAPALNRFIIPFIQLKKKKASLISSPFTAYPKRLPSWEG
jgi:hypothetical protein